MTQPTALFLADVLDADADSGSHHAAAAAELRRLTRERDALLMALQRMANIIDQMGDMPDGFIHPSPWQELKCEEALAQARAALAQEQAEPVQEPVAVIRSVVAPGDDGVRIKWLRGFPQIGDRLYTAPPQRKPLTRGEIMDLCASQWASHPVEVARLIERAHGIGDNT